MTASTITLKWHRTTDESVAAGYGRNAYYTATHEGTEYTAQPSDGTGWFLDAERVSDGANLGGWQFRTLRECKAHALKHAQVHGTPRRGYPEPVACTRCGRDTIGTVLLGMCRVCSTPGADGKVATPEGSRISPATAVLLDRERAGR